MPLCRAWQVSWAPPKFLQCFWLQGGEDKTWISRRLPGAEGVGEHQMDAPSSLRMGRLCLPSLLHSQDLRGQWAPLEAALEGEGS